MQTLALIPRASTVYLASSFPANRQGYGMVTKSAQQRPLSCACSPYPQRANWNFELLGPAVTSLVCKIELKSTIRDPSPTSADDHNLPLGMCRKQLRLTRHKECGHNSFTGDTEFDCLDPQCTISSMHPENCTNGGVPCKCRRFWGRPERVVTAEVEGKCNSYLCNMPANPPGNPSK
ncbi:hypothetical protein HGRIS_013064 [Hohenbuehelia grisea]|uniref:Uncharacterized protein n=1 Tax=Hohenbuehelia grisea TaxID=104357 RepID=A0ABR3IUG9_9AGAR